MRVTVKLYATLREYAPAGSEIGASFEVRFDGRTLSELIQHLGFELGRAKIVMINGIRVLDMDAVLHDDDLIVIFPPVGGG